MKKIAAGIGIAALVVVAQFALADDTTRTTTQSGSSMTVTGNNLCGFKTSASSSSADASASASCAATSSSSSSSVQPANRPDQKIKTKSNIKND